MSQIKHEQPHVFEELERIRHGLWPKPTTFATGTLLVMTHKAAALSSTSILTRAWHHPKFDPDGTPEEHSALARDFSLGRMVFDDPEIDEFIEMLPAGLYDFIAGQQDRHKNWKNRSRRDRIEIYRALDNSEMELDFERFNELMRLDLNGLETFYVDFETTPFGTDNTPTAAYRGTHGHRYHVGPKAWITASAPAHLTVVTTETLVCDVAERALLKSNDGRNLAFRLNLTELPGIYPIKIPTYLDTRAKKKGVSALASEILASNQNAIVIANGTKQDRVLTFQGAKGRNGLEDKDIYIIATHLAPEKYAQLNVLGQWLGRPDIIRLHYQDEINQAVGRNQGFRHQGGNAKTVVVTSLRLWTHTLDYFQNGAIRTLLYPEHVKPW